LCDLFFENLEFRRRNNCEMRRRGENNNKCEMN
jgi:hypothetical protein